VHEVGEDSRCEPLSGHGYRVHVFVFMETKEKKLRKRLMRSDRGFFREEVCVVPDAPPPSWVRLGAGLIYSARGSDHLTSPGTTSPGGRTTSPQLTRLS
jgi:hypothetical protein